jgi:PS-10 peptidase S37
MRKILLIALILTAQITISQSIENLLFELPNVIFKEIESNNPDITSYELKIKQPVDHNNSDKGYFYQRAFLNHRSVENPTVLVTEGYMCTNNMSTELTELLNANQLAVEHRFFGQSIPSPVDYDYLNLEQATADLHYVNTLFKNIYPDGWVSTGISKGGATTIFYRYFYPEDVDVSVPYVAPINKEFEEKRIYQFLDTIGTDECREKIYKLQVRLLKNRDKIIPSLRYYSKGAGLSFNYLSIEEAFEYAVLEYPFSFFQWGFSCDGVPDGDASLDEVVDYLLEVSGIDFFSDRAIEAFGSHYYQSAEEMGYYGYETEKFKKLLKALPTENNPHATFLPNKLNVEFDITLLNDINSWIEENGNQFIYIYGAMDTWSASAIQPSEKVDALWYFMQGKHHGNARINNMSEAEKSELKSTIERWLNAGKGI